MITIKSVELKDSQGLWVTVIEPDKQVDLAAEEPSVSFFNNGRVVPGNYVNFRIVFLDERGERKLSAVQDAQKPLALKKGSFVNVNFKLELSGQAKARQAEITVDETIRAYSAFELVES